MSQTVVWKNYDATGRDLHVDVPLSNAVINYTVQGLVGDYLFPIVPVRKQSNMIPVIPLGEFLREEAAYRAPGTEANKVKFAISTQTYFCKNYALKFPLTIEDRENADEIWQVRENGARLIVDGLTINKELRCFNVVNSGTNVNTIYVPKSAWNNGGNPLDAIETIIYRVEDTTGFRPNRMVLGRTAYRTLKVNSFLRGLLFPHGGGLVSEANLSDLFDVEVRVARGYYNSAGEGFTASLSKFFDDAVFAFYNPPGAQVGPGPRYSATFRWTIPGIPNMAVEVHPFDQKTKSEEIEVGVYDVEQVLDSTLGVIIKGVNSAQAGGV